MKRYTQKNKLSNTGNVPVYYDVLEPNRIFGMVGRCGGGHNTVWADWTHAGRIARQNIIREFEQGLNNICGHYEKLEKSILENGMRDPLIITLGWPLKKKRYNLPPEIVKLNQRDRFLLEGNTGGSRLWVAQKHGIPVPCIINDLTRSYNSGHVIRNIEEAYQHFKDVPKKMTMTYGMGLNVKYDDYKVGFHLGNEWSEDRLVKERGPLWVKLMNKYGYYVSGLSKEVEKYLRDNGVVQPAYLRERWEDEIGKSNVFRNSERRYR